MEVIRADAMGLCFGVRDALALMDGVAEPELVTIRGELVHNPVVLDRLDARGFLRQGEVTADRSAVPETPLVLITAHGVSDTERARLEAAGKQLVDTTCPLVRRAHRAALSLQAKGYHVVVIGRPDHVEVRGLVGDLHDYDVVASEADVRRYEAPRIGILCQTTTPPRTAQRLKQAIERLNPQAEEVRFVDTVCRPTRERQRAVAELVDRVEAVVVVGGRNSNNTRELVNLCRERGVSAWQVEGPEDLDPRWFAGLRRVGLTAGTSTLDVTIDAVHEALERLEPEAQPPTEVPMTLAGSLPSPIG